jgi:hypothetical protein
MSVCWLAHDLCVSLRLKRVRLQTQEIRGGDTGGVYHEHTEVLPKVFCEVAVIAHRNTQTRRQRVMYLCVSVYIHTPASNRRPTGSSLDEGSWLPQKLTDPETLTSGSSQNWCSQHTLCDTAKDSP